MITVKIQIVDDDGVEYSVGDIQRLVKSIEKLNADEKEVLANEQRELFPQFEIMAMPVKKGGEWSPDAKQLARWKQRFPGLAIRSELDKARVWLLDNPSRLKTSAGMPRFCSNWLSRAMGDAVERSPVLDPAPKPTAATPMDGKRARFRLIRDHKLTDAADWPDDRCLAEWKRLEVDQCSKR